MAEQVEKEAEDPNPAPSGRVARAVNWKDRLAQPIVRTHDLM